MEPLNPKLPQESPISLIKELTLHHIRDPTYHLGYMPELRDIGLSGHSTLNPEPLNPNP